MTRRMFRLTQVVFNRLQQQSHATSLNQGLKGDPIWESLTGREHQIIGKTIARYSNVFVGNCPLPVKIEYIYTNKQGRGIYSN